MYPSPFACEYPLAITILEHAIAEAEKYGLFGREYFGKRVVRLTLASGAEPAPMCAARKPVSSNQLKATRASRADGPPFPVTDRTMGKPTVVNMWKNLGKRPRPFLPVARTGTPPWARKTTRGHDGVFARRVGEKTAGLVEVPFGITLRDMIYEIGGGVRANKPCKAVQTGGPSVGCIRRRLDLAIDSIDVPENRRNMGTGGIHRSWTTIPALST